MDEDCPVCWICLGTPEDKHSNRGELIQVCGCPREVHRYCISRWQLQRAGTRSDPQTPLYHPGYRSPYVKSHRVIPYNDYQRINILLSIKMKYFILHRRLRRWALHRAIRWRGLGHFARTCEQGLSYWKLKGDPCGIMATDGTRSLFRVLRYGMLLRVKPYHRGQASNPKALMKVSFCNLEHGSCVAFNGNGSSDFRVPNVKGKTVRVTSAMGFAQ